MILYNSRNRSIQYILLALFSISMVIINQLFILPSLASNVERSVLEDDILIYVPRYLEITGSEPSKTVYLLGQIYNPLIASGQNLPTEASEKLCNLEQNKLNIQLAQRKVTNLPQGEYGDYRKIFNTDIDIPTRPKCELKVSIFASISKDRLLKLKVVIPELSFIKEYEPFLIEKMP